MRRRHGDGRVPDRLCDLEPDRVRRPGFLRKWGELLPYGVEPTLATAHHWNLAEVALRGQLRAVGSKAESRGVSRVAFWLSQRRNLIDRRGVTHPQHEGERGSKSFPAEVRREHWIVDGAMSFPSALWAIPALCARGIFAVFLHRLTT